MTTHESKPVVMLSGGSQGLGFELSKVLLQRGFAVSTCARRAELLAAALDELRAIGPVVGIAGDVADDDFRSRWIHATDEAFGRIDALVNNASTLGHTPLPMMTVTSLHNIRHVNEVNVIAPVALTQLALPYLLRNPRSLILGISSDAASGGYAEWGVYGSSKAAIDLIHYTLATELAGDPANTPSPVWVYTVDPGDMDTAMHHAAIPGDTGLASPAQVAQAIVSLFDVFYSTQQPLIPSGYRCVVREGQLVVKQR